MGEIIKPGARTHSMEKKPSREEIVAVVRSLQERTAILECIVESLGGRVIIDRDVIRHVKMKMTKEQRLVRVCATKTGSLVLTNGEYDESKGRVGSGEAVDGGEDDGVGSGDTGDGGVEDDQGGDPERGAGGGL